MLWLAARSADGARIRAIAAKANGQAMLLRAIAAKPRAAGPFRAPAAGAGGA